MNRLRQFSIVAGAAVRIGIADFKSTRTWQGWTAGWFIRLITQAIFFTSFGLWLHSHSFVSYMAVGNTVMLVCMEALIVIPVMVTERFLGTLPLQLTAPGNFIVSYLARNIYCPLIGIFSSSVAFYGITALFGVHLPWPAAAFVPLLIGLTGLAVYTFGLTVATLAMTFPSITMIAINFSYLSMMALSGVNVPTSYWPRPIGAIAQLLPVTHGLLAVRELIAGSPASLILRDSALTAVNCLGWLAAGALVLTLAARAGRRTGKLELAG